MDVVHTGTHLGETGRVAAPLLGRPAHDGVETAHPGLFALVHPLVDAVVVGEDDRCLIAILLGYVAQEHVGRFDDVVVDADEHQIIDIHRWASDENLTTIYDIGILVICKQHIQQRSACRRLGGEEHAHGRDGGPEGGDAARKLGRMIRDAEWAENAGFDSIWIPQVPGDFDALIAVAAVGPHQPGRDRYRKVVPLHAQHPIALARQALAAHAVSGGRVVLGMGPSHHWIVQDMPASRTRSPRRTPATLDVLDQALHGRDRSTWRTPRSPCTTRLTSGRSAPLPVMLSALGP